MSSSTSPRRAFYSGRGFSIRSADRAQVTVPVTCRLDAEEEIAYFRAGGLLPLICEQLLRAA